MLISKQQEHQLLGCLQKPHVPQNGERWLFLWRDPSVPGKVPSRSVHHGSLKEITPSVHHFSYIMDPSNKKKVSNFGSFQSDFPGFEWLQTPKKTRTQLNLKMLETPGRCPLCFLHSQPSEASKWTETVSVVVWSYLLPTSGAKMENGVEKIQEYIMNITDDFI